ncbi:hypothetical protein GQ42DRAFT_56819 [Ramicandelaber brevisporus]|nr:hypothetical protein GQ42DRAFT_56819 [Ramicandelaber brevisporus]
MADTGKNSEDAKKFLFFFLVETASVVDQSEISKCQQQQNQLCEHAYSSLCTQHPAFARDALFSLIQQHRPPSQILVCLLLLFPHVNCVCTSINHHRFCKGLPFLNVLNKRKCLDSCLSPNSHHILFSFSDSALEPAANPTPACIHSFYSSALIWPYCYYYSHR